MDFRILGPLEVVRDGRAIDLGGAKQRSVLAVLIVNARRVVSAEKLSDAVWEGVPPRAAATTLRSYISNLRKVMGSGEDSVLVTRDGGYALDVPAGSIDAEAFEDMAGRGRSVLIDGDAAGSAKLLGEALSLWRGDALQEFAYTSFADVEARRLEDVRLGAIEDLMEARLALGEHAQLTAELEALTARHPLRERLWRARMLALARSERTGEAVEAYDHARRHLSDELGIDPSPELRRVHESILARSDEVEPTRPVLTAKGAHIASFVFTDVERSTRMLRSLGEPERYAELIEQKRRLLRKVFDARGSRFIQAVGEELFATFDSPTAAVHAALDAQRALASHDWGDDAAQVLVRMGVHTGETTIVAGEYVGLAVHLASRICDAGHGGQVLLSHASAELLDADAIQPARLADLGPHLLKDFDEPIHLHQLVHADLRRVFPALRTLSATPHNLPPRLTSFVGREEDISDVASLLGDVRLVTLSGVGGVGKTRLALEVGAEVLSRYPDGVWLCELAAVTDGDGVVQAVSNAIGLQRPPVPTAGPRAMLIAALEQRRTLLILDNCEHLLDPVAELIDVVLRECANVDVLATSREGLGVRGEHIRPLRSLSVPGPEATLSDDDSSAVRLFVDRARAVRPEFDVGPHNVEAVVDICRRLDGIPLAIELAAVRTTSMGPLEIAARLDKAFRFLRSGDRTAVERHRTLRGAIDWSYGSLGPDEKTLFARLSVFVGGFTSDAVGRVCSDDIADVDDVLGGLVAKHLVVADVGGTGTRYSLLETIRQYALDRLAEEGDEQGIRDAHGEYYVGLAGAATAAYFELSPLPAIISDEIGNLRATLGWAITSSNLDRAVRLLASLRWYAGGNLPAEVQEWSFRVLDMPGVDAHPLGAICIGIAAYVAWARSEFDLARTLAERALALVPDTGDVRRVEALTTLAAVAMFEGRLDAAAVLADEIISLGDQSSTMVWRVNHALIAGYGGDRERALALLDELAPAVAAFPYVRVHHSYVRAEVLGEDDPDAGIAAAEEAYVQSTAVGNHFIAKASQLRAASLRGRYGDRMRALRDYAELIDAWRLSGNRTQQWLTLLNLVELFVRIQKDAPAMVLVGAADADPLAPRVYGAQADRLECVVRDVGARLGAEGSATARTRGTRMTFEEAVAFARAEIDDALEQLSGGSSSDRTGL